MFLLILIYGFVTNLQTKAQGKYKISCNIPLVEEEEKKRRKSIRLYYQIVGVTRSWSHQNWDYLKYHSRQYFFVLYQHAIVMIACCK